MHSSTAPCPNPKETFLAELERIERIVASIGRRHSLSHDDVEEFASLVNIRLIEDDYGVLRKFQGRSTVGTYLTVVIANLFRDYRIQKWGRWRPSAAAKRLGALAVRLETLLYRDGYRLREAIQVLHSTGTATGEAEITRLAAELPPRQTARRPGRDVAVEVEGAEYADRDVDRAEHERMRDEARGAIDRALDSLPAEDRLILRLRFWDGLSVADIARALNLEQKRLYRRLEYALARIRPLLEADGVGRERALELAAGDWP